MGAWLWSRRYHVIYLVLAAWFVRKTLASYDRHTGFTVMETFGEKFADRRLAQLREVPIHTRPDSYGYDGQWYAQVAVAGNPLAPELRGALDSPAYRARRSLMPVLAHLAGLGRPVWVLNAYALSGLVCWLLLALALARWWFPPRSLHDLARWTGTMFGVGAIMSVSHSLTDGPMLLLLAAGLRCVELRKRWLGAALLGSAGLVRETSFLGAAALVPPERRDAAGWRRAALEVALCLAPPVLWGAVLHARFGGEAIPPSFSIPFAGLVSKLRDVQSGWSANGPRLEILDQTLPVIALSVQAVFLLARPRPRAIWWRVGALFAVLWLLLGQPVWEGTPGAAARTLLPLTLAFNVLAPRTRLGLVLLLAGNLTVASARRLGNVAPVEQTLFVGGVRRDYGGGWHQAEYLDRRVWRWASGGSATIDLTNPDPRPRVVTLELELSSVTARTVELRALDERKVVPLEAEKRIRLTFGPLVLLPGKTSVVLSTAEPPWREKVESSRPLTFAVHDLFVRVEPR